MNKHSESEASTSTRIFKVINVQDNILESCEENLSDALEEESQECNQLDLQNATILTQNEREDELDPKEEDISDKEEDDNNEQPTLSSTKEREESTPPRKTIKLQNIASRSNSPSTSSTSSTSVIDITSGSTQLKCKEVCMRMLAIVTQ